MDIIEGNPAVPPDCVKVNCLFKISGDFDIGHFVHCYGQYSYIDADGAVIPTKTKHGDTLH